ncbi:MAG: hypothetical protein ACHREM_10430 [Polyangiales bacterium]
MRSAKNHDLTAKEQAHVTAAISFLRRRYGTYEALSVALGFNAGTITQVRSKRRVTPQIAFRVARLANVSIDDILSGKYPDPSACVLCGRSGPIDRQLPPVPSLDDSRAAR